jgi:hypothetical protein
MTDGSTLHPVDPDLAHRYVRALRGELAAGALAPADAAWAERLLEKARDGHVRARRGEEAGANAISLGLAQVLATAQPSFYLPGASLTALEARIERGVGMLMRPPSRLFGEAGLDVPAARAMPIRLDLAGGAMGGAFLPARLAPQFAALLRERETRMVRRMVEAEMDAVAVFGALLRAAEWAEAHGLGLYEALDAIVPEAPAADPPGAVVVAPDRKALDPAVRKRLEEAAKPPKKPGLFARLRGPRGGERDG